MTMTASTVATQIYGATNDNKWQLDQLKRVINNTATSSAWCGLFIDEAGQQDPMSWGPNMEALFAAERALAHIENISQLERVMNTFDCRPRTTGRLFLVLISMDLDPPDGLVHHPEAYALSVATIMARMYSLRHGIRLS